MHEEREREKEKRKVGAKQDVKKERKRRSFWKKIIQRSEKAPCVTCHTRFSGGHLCRGMDVCDENVLLEICSHLDPHALVSFGATCRDVHRVIRKYMGETDLSSLRKEMTGPQLREALELRAYEMKQWKLPNMYQSKKQAGGYESFGECRAGFEKYLDKQLFLVCECLSLILERIGGWKALGERVRTRKRRRKDLEDRGAEALLKRRARLDREIARSDICNDYGIQSLEAFEKLVALPQYASLRSRVPHGSYEMYQAFLASKVTAPPLWNVMCSVKVIIFLMRTIDLDEHINMRTQAF